MTLWPSVAEERAIVLRTRLKSWRSEGLISTEASDRLTASFPTIWRHHSMFVAVAFFVLTTWLLQAFFFFCVLLELPKGWITGIAAIVVAELLIQRKRFFGTGIESALWIGGLFAFIFGLPSQGKPEALLVFAAAAGIAGIRVRNAYFGVLGWVLVVVYLAVKHGEGRNVWSGGSAPLAIVLSLSAAAALLREWQRPSTNHLFAATVIALPLAGYVAGKIVSRNSRTESVVLVLFATLAVIFLILGIRARDRVLLAAAAISVALVAIEARDLIDWGIEWKLIACGAVMISIAAVLSRTLREKTAGFVTTPMALTPYDEAIQMAGAVASAHPVDAPPPGREGGGGFGGAGATGEY